MIERNTFYKIKSAIIGHSVGDALGVPVEFCGREELDANPVEDMQGFGTYPYPAGCWSDDTSMTLAALDSLANGNLDWDNIMKNFGKWYYEYAYTPTGEMFDVGKTCSIAIDNYFKQGKSAYECGLNDLCSNGNGSLMRIIPFILFIEFRENNRPWLDIIHKASALTHAHERSEIACGIYAFVFRELLKRPTVESIQNGLKKAESAYGKSEEFYHFERLFQPGFKNIGRHKIQSSGYVVDTLEASIWCLLTTDNYHVAEVERTVEKHMRLTAPYPVDEVKFIKCKYDENIE